MVYPPPSVAKVNHLHVLTLLLVIIFNLCQSNSIDNVQLQPLHRTLTNPVVKPPHPTDSHRKNNGIRSTPLKNFIPRSCPPPSPNKVSWGSAKVWPSAHDTGTQQSQRTFSPASAIPSTSTTCLSALTMTNRSGTERSDKLSWAQKVKDSQAAETALQKQLNAKRLQRLKEKKVRQDAHKKEEEQRKEASGRGEGKTRGRGCGCGDGFPRQSHLHG